MIPDVWWQLATMTCRSFAAILLLLLVAAVIDVVRYRIGCWWDRRPR